MAFLKNPKAFAGGVINMNFRGIESWQDGREETAEEPEPLTFNN